MLYLPIFLFPRLDSAYGRLLQLRGILSSVVCSVVGIYVPSGDWILIGDLFNFSLNILMCR